MITAITYQCDPESLGEVSQEDFVDAFENEIRVKPKYRNLEITVTFNIGLRSEITMFSSDDWTLDIRRENEFQEEFKEYAEKAFNKCLE